MDWKDALTKADEMLNSAAARVERHQLTKWFVLGIIGGALLFTAWAAFATGSEHVVKHGLKWVKPVKPPVVAPPVAPPPVASSPVTSAPPAPAQQPAAPHKGPGVMAYAVMAGVAIYFGAVIRSHMIWCAEDDKKKKEDRKCYRPLRDGMP